MSRNETSTVHHSLACIVRSDPHVKSRTRPGRRLAGAPQYSRIQHPMLSRCHQRCSVCQARLPDMQLVADVADASDVLPVGLGIITAALLAYGALRVWSGSQLTFVTAAMLSRNLPKTELRIVQIGGTVKELYYYPSTTVQVTVVGEDVKEGLMESAAQQAAVPVVCRKHSLTELGSLGSAVADAVVVLGGLQTVANLQTFFAAVLKVLKPGGRFIFIQSVSDESRSPVQSLLGAKPLEMTKLEALKRARDFESVQWDVANEALDPHVVGMAVKRAGNK